MSLKFRHRLGFESVCAEVADSISWRRFCRIPLDGRAPHPTTLMKLTTRCEDAVAGLNEALWAKAADETVACALGRKYLAMIIASAFTLPPDPPLPKADACRRPPADSGGVLTLSA